MKISIQIYDAKGVIYNANSSGFTSTTMSNVKWLLKNPSGRWGFTLKVHPEGQRPSMNEAYSFLRKTEGRRPRRPL